jgi:LacI family transcriptional regulator
MNVKAEQMQAETVSRLAPDVGALDAVACGRAPLHARIREELRDLAMTRFADGDRFFSEPVLIAQLGVSQGTVRRALTDLAREGLLVRKVPSGTFVRKPATHAMDIRVIMPGCDSFFLMMILEQILGHCQRRKLPVRIHHTHQGEHVSEALLQLKGSPTEQRVILLGEAQRAARELYVALAKRGYRVVNIDTLAGGCGDAYVGVDNEIGIRLGMEHLMKLGHRRIVLLVNEPPDTGNIRARVRAFRSVVREAGLTGSRVVVSGPGVWGSAANAKVGELLASKPAPTAIFTVSDPGAWTILRCLTELGVKAPEQISVLGFDDDRASAFMQPALSTLAQPIELIAQRALDLLTQVEIPSGMELLPPKLIVRESTGPVAK